MKKSVNAWTIPADVGFRDMFAVISSAGFDGIELNLDAPGRSNHSLGMDTQEEILADIRKFSSEYDLKVAGISTSLSAGMLGSDEKATREAGKDLIRKQIELASKLGTDAILIAPGAKAGETSFVKAYENVSAALYEMKPEIMAEKVSVCLENVWNGFFLSPLDMSGMIDRLDCPYIKAYFDVGNVAAFSNPEYWIDVLGKRIGRIHVKDFKRNTGNINSGGVFVGLLEGSINWRRVMASLRAASYESYLTAELGVMAVSPGFLYSKTSGALDVILSLD
ncbi:MAG: sugar phosphate isomerase/epimerase [Eubacteriales bacterium]|nr:sugar phosphate isomerase/epimerase [Eubacteriales bacterium]